MSNRKTVVWTQTLNGEQTGDETPVEPTDGREGHYQMLKRKAESHEAHGWTVTWLSDDEFHAWKVYPRTRKDRYFKIKD